MGLGSLGSHCQLYMGEEGVVHYKQGHGNYVHDTNYLKTHTFSSN